MGIEALRGVAEASRGFRVGELSVPSSEELRRWPFDRDNGGLRCALTLKSGVPFEPLSSSRIVSTDTGLPTFFFDFADPEF